ncbi:MAG: membrane protein insertion efficiency factor YidD [Candidatus Omnitrophica bacterium]|nr:membrane protein insertion efficiency factor YidD [Candidatus Omnitrophota bacterium]
MLEKFLLGLIQAYQNYLRGLLPASCRFQPSCSEYARQAIIKYGPFSGMWRLMKRILSCHPWSGQAGYDPV